MSQIQQPPGQPLLSARNLSVRFGGVLAVNNVSFDVRQGEVFTLIGPNGAGKTTVFNLISRIYTPTSGEIDYLGKKLTDQPPHKIAALGIARTFQNIELFEHATVLHNLLIGRHTHRQTGLWSEIFFTKKTREAEIQAREKAEQIIDLLDLMATTGWVANIERGPGRHGISNAFFLYILDPDGHRIAIYCSDYQTVDPDLEPIKWDLKDPQRQTLWGAPAPKSWFEHGSLFAGAPVRESDLKAQPIIAP